MPLVNGTGNSPSPGQPTPGVVKQDKSSRGSVDTTKTRSGPQRVRMSSGERPIGAAKGNNQIPRPCVNLPPPLWSASLLDRRGTLLLNASACRLPYRTGVAEGGSNDPPLSLPPALGAVEPWTLKSASPSAPQKTTLDKGIAHVHTHARASVPCLPRGSCPLAAFALPVQSPRSHCRRIFCAPHSRKRSPLCRTTMQYVVAEGSHKRMYHVCDVCHGMYQNAVQKHSGFMALVMAYKVCPPASPGHGSQALSCPHAGTDQREWELGGGVGGDAPPTHHTISTPGETQSTCENQST